jgi:hypothetical protein
MTWELHTAGTLGNIWIRSVDDQPGGDVEYCVMKLEDAPPVYYKGFAGIDEALYDFVINGWGWKYDDVE